MDSLTLDKFPAELRGVAQWCLWKLVRRPTGDTKVPFRVDGQTPASSTGPETWATFAAVKARVSKTLRPGFVFSIEDPYCGIDLDGCRDPETGKVEEWGRNIVRMLDSYTEVSPSGTGLKVFCKASLAGKSGKKKELDYPKLGAKKPGIEIYDHGRFFAVTGLRLAGLPATVEDRQGIVDELVETIWGGPAPIAPKYQSESEIVERARRYVARMPEAVSGSRGHDRTFAVACVLILGFGLSPHDAMGVMWDYNARCVPPWSEKELTHKIDQATKRPGERNYLRHTQQSEWDTMKVPAYAQMQAEKPKPTAAVPRKSSTLQDAVANFSQELRKGPEVFITTGLEDLDKGIGGGMAESEMWIMAARPGHGKSALGLQFIDHWTEIGLDCLFVSEEMVEKKLAKRVVQAFSDLDKSCWSDNVDQIDAEADLHFQKRAKCYIVYGCGTVDAVIKEIERHVVEHGVRCVVLDYVQLLKAPGKDATEQIRNVSIALREATNRLNILVLLLAQLGRVVDSRTVFVPKMSDIKDCGQLEQDADGIIFNVWPCKVDLTAKPEEYKFYLAKNRNREVLYPVVNCYFDADKQTVRLSSLKAFDDPFPKNNSDPF